MSSHWFWCSVERKHALEQTHGCTRPRCTWCKVSTTSAFSGYLDTTSCHAKNDGGALSEKAALNSDHSSSVTAPSSHGHLMKLVNLPERFVIEMPLLDPSKLSLNPCQGGVRSWPERVSILYTPRHANGFPTRQKPNQCPHPSVGSFAVDPIQCDLGLFRGSADALGEPTQELKQSRTRLPPESLSPHVVTPARVIVHASHLPGAPYRKVEVPTTWCLRHSELKWLDKIQSIRQHKKIVDLNFRQGRPEWQTQNERASLSGLTSLIFPTFRPLRCSQANHASTATMEHRTATSVCVAPVSTYARSGTPC